MQKDTSEILKALEGYDQFKSFYSENKQYMIKDSLSCLLDKLFQKCNLTKSQVIENSLLSSNYAYQIFSGLRVPERKKLLSLALAMKPSLDDVQTLLKAAGYAPLYVKIPFDSIVIYAICKQLSVAETNEILFDYDLETLG